MTIHDDRNPDRPLANDPINRPISAKRVDSEGWSMTSLVLGGLAALAVVFGIFFMMSDRSVRGTATTMDRTAPVTTPTTMPAQPRASETTGSGAVTPPVAPSTAPATAR